MYSKTVSRLATARKRQGSPAARRYLKQVKKLLPCSRLRIPFLSRLEDELFLFCAEAENADWDALLARFGPPENTADEFMSDLEPWQQRRFLRTRRRMIAAVCAVFAVVGGLSLLYAVRCQWVLNNSHWIEWITYFPDTPPEPTGPTYDYYEFSSGDNTGETPDQR